MESSARVVRVWRVSVRAKPPREVLPKFWTVLTTSWVEVVGRTSRPGFCRVNCRVIDMAANETIAAPGLHFSKKILVMAEEMANGSTDRILKPGTGRIAEGQSQTGHFLARGKKISKARFAKSGAWLTLRQLHEAVKTDVRQ